MIKGTTEALEMHRFVSGVRQTRVERRGPWLKLTRGVQKELSQSVASFLDSMLDTADSMLDTAGYTMRLSMARGRSVRSVQE